MKKQENMIHQEKRNITETHTDTQVLEHFKDEAFKIPLNMFISALYVHCTWLK